MALQNIEKQKGKTNMNKTRKWLVPVTTVILLVTIIASAFTATLSATGSTYYGESPYISLSDSNLHVNKSDYFDSSVVYKLADKIKPTDDISVIIEMPGYTVLDKYNESGKDISFTEYVNSKEAGALRKEINNSINKNLAILDETDVRYEKGVQYSTLLCGFEVVIKAKDYETVCMALGESCNIYVGESYERAETELVENTVNVYETGIFNSSGFGYDGTGMVVAVLDTGLDYYHTAFSTGNFTADRNKLGLTFTEVEKLLSEKDFAAEVFQSGLTASDVYINEKVPFGYDYADKDSEVFPIRQDHGTHVAGIIAGKDDTITGAAPNAQLAIMKIFSDTEDTSRASWIIAALEDCVNLGVDVINMSIGTACGFSTPSDKELESKVYEKIDEMGMSLIVAASNSFNSTYASEKNGNLGLTSNPDSATIGSPATYKGALAVASISGVRTSYLLYNGKIIYFLESTNRVSEENKFVEELLGKDKTELEIEYVKIPGAGRTADYTGIDIKGKIALVSRGATTFEEKANAAEKMGAAGVIIYNNVSGDIKMNVGDTSIPVCSISQDAGKELAEAGSGTLKVSYSQSSGPFMSDFSSWGPGPDLEIKPEITAHGGSILSAIPGQDYDRISGTSMATPNISGVAALLRQYVIETFPSAMIKDANGEVSLKKVTAIINRLMMSTADIVLNQNGLPYSVRKQGAGLANLFNSAKTGAYILTYDRKDGSVMDKSKIELGDDPAKTGVYVLKFAIDNFGSKSVSYDLSAYVMTEGVSETLTGHGETTVTETAYILDGASVVINSVNGGTLNGNNITVAAGQRADIQVTIKLGDKDKKYLDDSFKNGMYVEGFVNLTATSADTVNLSAPYLAFYGDWSVAPLFDLTYFETDKDELDDSLDLNDKTLADAFATRPVGGLYSDYVSYLGSYYYEQKPGSNKIAADRKYISLSNQTDSINSLSYVWGGLLRNAAKINITITDDATGEVVYNVVETNIRKSYGDGGPIRPANIEIHFSAIEENLKNNTQYTVTLKGLLDYENDGAETNLNNTISFPLYTDFEAPAVTGCEFYTEYDRSTKKTKFFAKVAVYDNHYSMSTLFGYTKLASSDLDGNGVLDDIEIASFDKYLTPVYSTFNGTSYVVYELTDYIDEIKHSIRPNNIVVCTYDYALNQAIYDIGLPAEFTDLYFEEQTVTLSPNELYTLSPKIYPNTEWNQLLTYRSSNDKVVRVIGNELVAVSSGTAKIIAEAKNDSGEVVKSASVTVKVLAEGDEGYKKITAPVVKDFRLTGFKVNKAYFFLNSEDRKIGKTGDTVKFVGANLSLSMYPSESVTVDGVMVPYFDNTEVVFETSNPSIVSVTEDGTITAKAEGFASVTAKIMQNGKGTYYSKTISIEVKDPYVTSGPTLTNYYGNGGRVSIPATLAVTEIGQFAFTNYNYCPKTSMDLIDDENPETTKVWYLGDNTIEEIVIPEGIEVIGSYAFAGLTNLKKVTLPSTIKKIEVGAFYNCVNLKEVVGIEKVQFFNQSCFANTALVNIKLDSAIAIADYAFSSGLLTIGTYNENTETYNTVEVTSKKLASVTLSSNTQSIGAYAFAGNTNLKTVKLGAAKLKVGQFAFTDCRALESIDINAAVIPNGTFYGCTSLATLNIGKDVNVIGEYAFGNTKVSTVTVSEGNTKFYPVANEKYLVNKDGTEVLFVAPTVTEFILPANSAITSIGAGAFSGNTVLTKVNAPSITKLNDCAFSECTSLSDVTLGKLSTVGKYAFFKTKISAFDFTDMNEIGAYSFSLTKLTSVNIPDGMKVGAYAFAECDELASVTVGNNVILSRGAFAYNLNRDKYSYEYGTHGGEVTAWYVYTSPLTSLSIGNNVVIGDYGFFGAAALTHITLGEGAKIGASAFYNCGKLTTIDFSKVKSIGDSAFYGDYLVMYYDQDLEDGAPDSSVVYGDDGNPIYVYNSAPLTQLDLTSLTSLGEQAFAYNRHLTKVTLGSEIKKIPYGAFYECNLLSDINLSGIEVIGGYSFISTALTQLDLTSVNTVGEYAFLTVEGLTSVVLGDAIDTVAEGAFSYCKLLTSVQGMEKIKSFGDYAFAYTGLTSADLSSAIKLGSHAFMKEAVTDFAVTLGDSLTEVGDNPFAYCNVKALSETVVKESFNGVDYKEEIFTFDISDSVKVIDGSLYRVVPNGLEFIAYLGDEATFKVADGTVRLSAYSFAGTSISDVILPYTVASIGHKAFFDCDKLSLVTFTSYNAPVLEEEYDYYLFAEQLHIPAKGDGGLGIVDYFMWNVTAMPSNVYYGANFVDHIGDIDDKIIMIRPSNGQNYNSFIFGQYFDTVIDGATAADDVTLAAIKAISLLPEKVTLADEALVIAAREAYNKIATNDQKALVLEFQKLVQAEKRIDDLKYLANGDSDTDTPPVTPPADTPADTEEPKSLSVGAIIGIVLGSVAGAAAIAAGAYFLYRYLKAKGIIGKKTDDDSSEENSDAAPEEETLAEEENTSVDEDVTTDAAPEEESVGAENDSAETEAENAAENDTSDEDNSEQSENL